MSTKGQQLTAIDFFCGAGGFSEGFRQQGIKVVKGLDNWKPAVDTHNLNHGLSDEPYDISSLWGKDSSDTSDIDSLPNTDIIVGSPPCVSFSMSNKAGKADKTLGIHLIKTYLRFVAVKKHQRGSTLKAWLLENVPNSEKYIEESYTFSDLNLKSWAIKNGHDPEATAFKKDGAVLVASDYGAPQARRRYVCGEVVSTGSFPLPATAPEIKTLGQIRNSLPSPFDFQKGSTWADPNYPNLRADAEHITDQFYDTGLYASEWDKARELKLHHPFMGKMSFPENLDKPSRTITATRSGSTRESLIFKSEVERKGHGEYRLPTIREAASLMGYPFTYQFIGSEGTKWKLIGNSVSPQLSFALAGEIIRNLGLEPIVIADVVFNWIPSEHNPSDLNDFKQKSFNSPRRRAKASKFRRVILKERNTTIELLNYHPSKEDCTPGEKWYLCAFRGTGQGYKQWVSGDNVIEDFISNFGIVLQRLHAVPASQLQEIYESDIELADFFNPVKIIQDLRDKLEGLDITSQAPPIQVHQESGFPMSPRQLAIASRFLSTPYANMAVA